VIGGLIVAGSIFLSASRDQVGAMEHVDRRDRRRRRPPLDFAGDHREESAEGRLVERIEKPVHGRGGGTRPNSTEGAYREET
jgi:hypothetical protein